MFGVLGLNASATSRVIKNQGGDYDEMSVSLAAETGAPGGNCNGVSAIHYNKMTLIFTLVCGSQGQMGSRAVGMITNILSCVTLSPRVPL